MRKPTAQATTANAAVRAREVLFMFLLSFASFVLLAEMLHKFLG